MAVRALVLRIFGRARAVAHFELADRRNERGRKNGDQSAATRLERRLDYWTVHARALRDSDLRRTPRATQRNFARTIRVNSAVAVQCRFPSVSCFLLIGFVGDDDELHTRGSKVRIPKRAG